MGIILLSFMLKMQHNDICNSKWAESFLTNSPAKAQRFSSTDAD